MTKQYDKQMTKQYDIHPALEAAGWTVTRSSSKTPSGEIIGIYWFTHAATGRIVGYEATEGTASGWMLAHLRDCEEQLVQKR